MSESVEEEIERHRQARQKEAMMDQEIARGIAAAAERPWTPVIENFDLDVKCLGTASAELKDRAGRRADGTEGDGHFRLDFDGYIYSKYGNVMQVTVKDENGEATVFLDPDDLLAAVQWMKRLYPVGKND